MNEQAIALGQELVSTRKARYLTQEEAAKQMGISVQSVRLAERGVAGFSNLKKIRRWIDKSARRRKR